MSADIDIAVCGNITIDFIIDQRNHLLPPLLGGNAFYTAVSSALWGFKTGIVSKVGIDYPSNYLNTLVEFGIDIKGISQEKTFHESICGIQYYENDERRYFNVNKPLIRSHPESLTVDNIEDNTDGESTPEVLPVFDPQPSNIPENYFRSSGIVLCSMVGSSQYKIAREFRNKNRAFCTCDGADFEEKPVSTEELLSNVDFYIPSEAEVSYIIGERDPRVSVDYFLSIAPELKAVIIKLGSKGAYGYDRQKDKYFYLPVYPCSKVLDTTGAGDSFCGGFMAGILETNDIFEAAKRAIVTSSVMIERYSANSIEDIDKKNLEERLYRYDRFISE